MTNNDKKQDKLEQGNKEPESLKQENGSKTREEIRIQKEKEKKKKQNPSNRIRLIPIWARIILVVLFFAASLIAGAMLGYGIVGDGEPRDVLNKETWQNIHDIIYKETE